MKGLSHEQRAVLSYVGSHRKYLWQIISRFKVLGDQDDNYLSIRLVVVKLVEDGLLLDMGGGSFMCSAEVSKRPTGHCATCVQLDLF